MNSLVLFDTHVVVWSVIGDRRLGRDTRRLVQRAVSGGTATISAASVYELVWIVTHRKVALGAPPDAILDRLAQSGFRTLDIGGSTARLAAGLKLPHGDPLDLLISATALQTSALLVTADKAILGSQIGLTLQDASL